MDAPQHGLVHLPPLHIWNFIRCQRKMDSLAWREFFKDLDYTKFLRLLPKVNFMLEELKKEPVFIWSRFEDCCHERLLQFGIFRYRFLRLFLGMSWDSEKILLIGLFYELLWWVQEFCKIFETVQKNACFKKKCGFWLLSL